MDKTVAKKSSVLVAIVLALILALAGFGMLTAAKADGAGATWGDIEYNNDGYTVNGTSADASQNKTKISWNWSAGAYYRIEFSLPAGVVEGESYTISLNLLPDSDAVLTWGLRTNGADGTYIEWGAALSANVAYTKNTTVSIAAGTTGINFYFDSATVTNGKKSAIIQEFTIAGAGLDGTVAYAPVPYVPEEVVEAPDPCFVPYTQWTASTGGTVSENTLPQTNTEPTAIDMGAGDIAIAAGTESVQVSVPFGEAIDAMPTTWTALFWKFKATNVKSVAVHFGEVDGDSHVFCNDITGVDTDSNPWNCSAGKSGTEGYSEAVISSLSTYITSASFAGGSVEKIVLVVNVADTTQAASLEIAGMTFGESKPMFVNDPVEVKLGDWAGTDCYTLTPNGSVAVQEVLEGSPDPQSFSYKGLKVEYTQTSAGAYVYAGISGYNYAKYPKLFIGFYTEKAVKLGIWFAATSAASDPCLLWYTDYEAGYHTIYMDMVDGEVTSDNVNKISTIKLYVDSQNAVAEANTVVFDSIAFCNAYDVQTDEATISTGSPFALEDTADSTVQFTYEVENDTAIGYHYVSVPVADWYVNNRYLLLDITLDSPLRLGVCFNTQADGVLINHVAYGAGRYVFCLDMLDLAFKLKNACANGKDYLSQQRLNYVRFYCDASGEVASGVKTVTVHEIAFSQTATFVSSPDASNVTLDFKNQSFTVKAGYEVSATADFATLLNSGDAIEPNTTLYLRGENNSTAATRIALPARPALSADDIPAATVGDNFIRWALAGYEFKMGDGAWSTLGSWGGLQAGTEYTVYVRKAATDTSFSSQEVTVTATTTGTAPAGSGDSGDGNGSGDNGSGSGSGSGTTAPKKKCGSSLGGSFALGGILLLLAAGAVIVLRKKARA